jgi:hypothetical protein
MTEPRLTRRALVLLTQLGASAAGRSVFEADDVGSTPTAPSTHVPSSTGLGHPALTREKAGSNPPGTTNRGRGETVDAAGLNPVASASGFESRRPHQITARMVKR